MGTAKKYVRAKLSEEETSSIYRKRIDVDLVFGFLKANLHYTRFSVRGKLRGENGMDPALMAVNFRKFTASS